MATAARIGHGSSFSLGATDNTGTTTYTALAEVTDITPPSDNIDVIDVTHMASPNATREYVLGLNDPGECSFTINFVPGTGADATLQAWRAARNVRSCRINFPNGVRWTFDGILTGYSPTVPTGDKMTADVTIKVTGSYVAAGTPA